MPSFTATVRCLALAGLGFGALPAFAQSANVTAFNPYNGVGSSSTPAPTSVYAMPQSPPAAGMAFNPWNPGGGASAPSYAPSASVQAGAYGGATSFESGPYSPGTYASGANLPPPPPGPIESRLTAVPQRPDRSAAPQSARVTAPPPAPPPPAPEPVVTRAEPSPPPASPPPAVAIATPTPAPPPPPAPVATPAPPPAPVVTTPPAAPPPPAAVASAAPPPPEPVAPRAAPTLASVTFVPNSAEISGPARTELDRVAQTAKGARAIELRAYAGGADPTEARKVALARALSVRSYLIDQGVKARIEVGAFASSNASGGSERVDVLGP